LPIDWATAHAAADGSSAFPLPSTLARVFVTSPSRFNPADERLLFSVPEGRLLLHRLLLQYVH
jgi:hypothetical protein